VIPLRELFGREVRAARAAAKQRAELCDGWRSSVVSGGRDACLSRSYQVARSQGVGASLRWSFLDDPGSLDEAARSASAGRPARAAEGLWSHMPIFRWAKDVPSQ